MVLFSRFKGFEEERESKDIEYCFRRKFQCLIDGVNFWGFLKLVECKVFIFRIGSWIQRKVILEVKGFRKIKGEDDVFWKIIRC